MKGTQMKNRRRVWRAVGLGAAACLVVVLTLSVADAGPGNSGFQTNQPAMLSPAAPGVNVKPLLSVGDSVDGYSFDGLPDGIAIDPRGSNDLVIYVNHESSMVPFLGSADLTNSQLSRLVLKRGTGKVMEGSFAIPSSANFLRFCSNFFAGAAQGFSMPLVFTNEETSDLVNRTGDAWPPGADAEQAGLVVALNPDTGEYRTIPGMGRHNHENSVAVPGYDDAVILSGDDTFSAPSSQLYMYIADDADAVWNDEGHLYAFKGDGVANDYGDITPGNSISGVFIPVPDEVADGDQNALQSWSNDNNVFQFIRVEDIAYDRNDPTVVYIADTGEPRAIPDPTDDGTKRLLRGPSGTQGPYPNGRIFKMELSPNDPTVVHSLSILIDGDALGSASAGVLSLIHNPDNLETTPYSLMIQEDPGGQNGYPAGDPNGTTARIWRYDLASGALSVVARVNQSADPTASQGNWESTGIVDASQYFGRGAFLVNIQAHSILVDSEVVPDPTSTTGGTITLKREAGQLLLLRVPGA